MTCPDKLHIPHKKWAVAGNVDNGTLEEQNLLRIERWANSLPCSEGGLPRAWCATSTETISAGVSHTFTATIPADVAQVMCHATLIVRNASGGTQTVNVRGYFYSDGALNDGYALEEVGFDWPDNAKRTIAATCLFTSSTAVGMQVFNDSAGDVSVKASIEVLEVDGGSGSCCVTAG